jgi:hypothetical protein
MTLIDKWLEGKRNFHVGVVLYTQFGKDDKLKKYFGGVPDDLKIERLTSELKKLAEKPKIVLAPVVNKESEDMPLSKDPVLRALRNEWLGIFQRMQYLRHELDRYHGNDPVTKSQRHTIAKEILEIEQTCMMIWAKRDEYIKNGTATDEQEDLPTNPIELAKLIEATKKNIRRNKQLSEKNPDNAAYPQKVMKYQQQLERILNAQNNGKS